MKLHKRLTAMAGAMLLMAGTASMAQEVGLKTNLLYDAALSPNLGVEIGLAPKWTLELSGQFNLWTIKNHKWKHWVVQPEARYWFCERFDGHFIGIHGLGGQYNAANLGVDLDILGINFNHLAGRRYQGWGVGGGIVYGYAWPVHKHWNVEAEIGVGYIYTKYDIYPCTECGTKIASDRHKNYWGPTKAAVNIVYLF